MEISVVIPVYNAEKTILRCLESLLSQTYRAFEIILVDNNSTDNSVQLIEAFIKRITPSQGRENETVINIHLIHEPKQGSCAARNKGASVAKGKIIVNTDPDCVADKEWLKDILSAFDDNRIGGVAGNIYGYNPQRIIEKFLSIFTLRGLGEQKIFDSYNLVAGGFATANLSIRKDVFKKICGFDENINFFGIGIGEDYDLCARIYNAGYRIKTITGGIIYHIHRSKIKGVIKQSFVFGLAHTVLQKKHFPRGLFLEFPRFTYIKEKFGIPIWLNFNSFDKKIFAICLVGYIIPAILICLPFYLIYHISDIKKRAAKIGITLSISERLCMLVLLFVKSFFMTIGRTYGSVMKKVICV